VAARPAGARTRPLGRGRGNATPRPFFRRAGVRVGRGVDVVRLVVPQLVE